MFFCFIVSTCFLVETFVRSKTQVKIRVKRGQLNSLAWQNAKKIVSWYSWLITWLVPWSFFNRPDWVYYISKVKCLGFLLKVMSDIFLKPEQFGNLTQSGNDNWSVYVILKKKFLSKEFCKNVAWILVPGSFIYKESSVKRKLRSSAY